MSSSSQHVNIQVSIKMKLTDVDEVRGHGFKTIIQMAAAAINTK